MFGTNSFLMIQELLLVLHTKYQNLMPDMHLVHVGTRIQMYICCWSCDLLGQFSEIWVEYIFHFTMVTWQHLFSLGCKEWIFDVLMFLCSMNAHIVMEQNIYSIETLINLALFDSHYFNSLFYIFIFNHTFTQ